MATHADSTADIAVDVSGDQGVPGRPLACGWRAGVRVRTTLLALSLICGLGAWLRLYSLGTKSLWLDEGVSAMIARLSWPEFWNLLQWREGNMALYYLLLRGWVHIGSSEFALRSLSAIAGVLTLPAIYLLGRGLHGRFAGLLAALLLALHPFHLRYSQEARSYALLGLTLVLAAYFLARAVRSSSDKDWTAFVLFCALSIYLHFLAVFVVMALLLSLLFLPTQAVGVRKWLGILSLLGLLTAPAAWYVFTHRDIGLIDWIPEPSWPLVARCATALAGVGGIAGILYAAVCVLPLVWRRIQSPASGPEAPCGLWALPALWSVVPGLLLFGASLYRPVLVERYLLMSVPGVVLLASYAVAHLQDRLRLPVAALLVLVSTFGTIRYFQTTSGEGEDWRGAVRHTIRHAQSGDIVLPDNGIVRPVFEYYRQQSKASAPRAYSFAPRGDELNYLDFANITRPQVLDRVAQVHSRVWIFEWGNGNALVPEIERRFRQAAAQQFLGVNVKLYVRDPN